MNTITEMNTAAEMTLPGRRAADGIHMDMAEVADLSTEDLLDRLSAVEQAEAVLVELQAAVLDEMARRWGTGCVRGA